MSIHSKVSKRCVDHMYHVPKMIERASYIQVPKRFSRAAFYWAENCGRSISRLFHRNPPILSHKYLVVPFPTPPTSASDEQLFSVGGRIVTSARSRLNARYVNELCCLHQWHMKCDDMMSREATRKADKTARQLKYGIMLDIRRRMGQTIQ